MCFELPQRLDTGKKPTRTNRSVGRQHPPCIPSRRPNSSGILPSVTWRAAAGTWSRRALPLLSAHQLPLSGHLPGAASVVIHSNPLLHVQEPMPKENDRMLKFMQVANGETKV